MRWDGMALLGAGNPAVSALGKVNAKGNRTRQDKQATAALQRQGHFPLAAWLPPVCISVVCLYRV